MGTLSDVNTRRDGKDSPNAGFASNVIPEAASSQTGVSVRYAQEATKTWYVLRVSYGRTRKVADIFDLIDIEYYYPEHHVIKMVDGKRKRVLEPLLPNLIFVYVTDETIRQIMADAHIREFVSYYYNHFKTNEFGKNPPLTIAYKSMINFIMATSVEDDHIIVVGDRKCTYKSGDRVRVTDGNFRGVEGLVARVAGEQRVVVELEGLCLIATAYIPTAFIRKIED